MSDSVAGLELQSLRITSRQGGQAIESVVRFLFIANAGFGCLFDQDQICGNVVPFLNLRSETVASSRNGFNIVALSQSFAQHVDVLRQVGFLNKAVGPKL